MIIQINKYDPEAFKFAQAYLKAEYDQWFSTPLHRLVSVEFLRKLENGKLDSNRYDIKFNPSRFDGEECLLLLRYYEKHNDMHKNYDRHVTMGRLYSELGSNGSIFIKRSNSGGRTSRKARRTRRRRT